jgi:transcriptional regulator with XRE-family HTH domain
MSMGNKDSKNTPFKKLGDNLKRLREVRSESLAEVSGAVEIEVEVLSSFEAGQSRPSEDILLLLISHFATKEDVANKLWELAGYDNDQLPGSNMINDDKGNASPSVMVMPPDLRIAYTDMVHVVANNYGVVMNFMQGAGPNNQALAVARIGMSKEHARSVIEVLQKTLAQSEPKKLPAPKQSKKTNNKKTN